MGQGKGSAHGNFVSAVVILCLLVVHFPYAYASTYVVGGRAGWTFHVVNWPKGKHFKAGDTLVFKYNKASHNVVAVNKAGYSSCRAPKGARVHRTGKDHIKLSKGLNFFICTVPGHWPAGMKIAIKAM